MSALSNHGAHGTKCNLKHLFDLYNFWGEDIKLVIMSEDQFNSFVEKVYQMHNLNKVPEVRMMKSDVKCPENWSFVNSIWNAGSMISSLGFSYTAPETFEGTLRAPRDGHVCSSLVWVQFGSDLIHLFQGKSSRPFSSWSVYPYFSCGYSSLLLQSPTRL